MCFVLSLWSWYPQFIIKTLQLENSATFNEELDSSYLYTKRYVKPNWYQRHRIKLCISATNLSRKL